MMQNIQQYPMAASLKGQVCQLLHWDEQQYGAFQYRCGCLYLQHYISIDPVAIDEVLQNRLYWNWWKSEWLDRDYILTGTLLKRDKLSIEEKREWYCHWHDARVLTDECSPVGWIMSNGYKTMIREIIKLEVI